MGNGVPHSEAPSAKAPSGAEQQHAGAAASPTDDSTAPTEEPPQPQEEGTTLADGAELSWQPGELQDLGPAGPASAAPRAVVMVTKRGELVTLPLDGQGRFRELPEASDGFAKYGRGPAVTERFAYFISLDGRLLRGSLARPEKVDELAARARPGTRVAALRSGERELVAFIAEVDGEPVAQLWSSTGEVLRATPEGGTASSVQLAPLGRGAVVVSLEGRTGMSPVHARLVRLAPRRVSLGEDQVVWVGPGAHPLTELSLVAAPSNRAFALVAAARSITEFGLASFALEEGLTANEEAKWALFPNGIDPAPVAAATACGRQYVFYAQPSAARPRSPQELRVATVGIDGLAGAEVIATARAFNDISVAARPGGATLVWTADRRTWAMTLGCPPRAATRAP